VGFAFYFVPTELGKVRQITTSYFRASPSAKDSSAFRRHILDAESL